MDTKDRSIMLSYAKDLVCAAVTQSDRSLTLDDTIRQTLYMADKFCAWLSMSADTVAISNTIRKLAPEIIPALKDRKIPVADMVSIWVACNKDEKGFIQALKDKVE